MPYFTHSLNTSHKNLTFFSLKYSMQSTVSRSNVIKTVTLPSTIFLLFRCPTLPVGLESRKLGFLLSQNQYRNSLLQFSDEYSTHIFSFFKSKQKEKNVLGIDRPYKFIHETKHVKNG